MKKLFTLLSAGTFAIAGFSQTIYFEDDFEGGSLTGNNAWTQQQPTGTDTWMYDNFSGDNFTEINSFPNDADAWLITPAIDISGATQPILTFQNTSGNFDGPDLEVYVSTTYTGGTINMGDWTQLTGFNLSPGSGDGYTEVGSGDIDLTSYISATCYVAFRHQGTSSPQESQEYQIDDVLLKEGPTVTPTLSIAEIQYTLSSPADSPEVGNEVETTGVVTALSLTGGSSGQGYFIQDADSSWSGLMVVDATNTPAVGDSVTVTGVIEENFSFTRMNNLTAYTNHGSPNVYVPSENIITASDANTLEEYESMLVTIEDAECTDDNAGNGLWTIDDGTDTCAVDDDCFDNTGVLGNWYDLTGIMTYSFSQYKINPRTGADLVVVGNASIEEETTQVVIYPNPADNNVVVNAAPEAIVSIYAMTGALVANGVSNKTIDVSNLEAGIYQVVITENGTSTSQKLMIK